ncbi:ribosome small subunit-dependent GTPase A [Rhodobacteraceae bacterium N5(2021)]|uniref:Small ribosomal subunit biogenesis GTPase RsgA n=1 Tax=Gymnodinialimonas phycosphaerae TaxID=2841589 RepID=A0A975YEJ4_9RHOB|nr:ribosome small subunit-dependent GTPase A [Gymnodinialimonas phycosphaerae]MBY4893736.1 ribosome small subunit-dependent GTPase A [Gymnodinialimonas phycosphaerae]
MRILTLSLADLGWTQRHIAQLTDEDAGATPARVNKVSRTRITALSGDGLLRLVTQGDESTGAYVTGDWVLADAQAGLVLRRLERDTLLTRRAAGSGMETQLIAANVDTLGIVTSCNADFNVARLERYLAMAASAGCLPLIILTKPDMTDDPREYERRAEALSPIASAIALNAKADDAAEVLKPWSKDGQTLALVGSSGVGKTTLANALTGATEATAGIREDDAKGRHTTTSRGLARTIFGGWLIDTPGMRALRLNDAADGIGAVFADIEELAETCKFRDCLHASEPGCAVQAAVAAGELEADRVKRFMKLVKEDEINQEAIHERRAREKDFKKMVKTAMSASKHKRGKK